MFEFSLGHTGSQQVEPRLFFFPRLKNNIFVLFTTILQRSFLGKFLKGGISLEVRFRSGLDQRQWWRIALGGLHQRIFSKPVMHGMHGIHFCFTREKNKVRVHLSKKKHDVTVFCF